MNIEQSLELLRMNYALFPQTKELDEDGITRAAKVWAFVFTDYPYDVVKRAYLECVKTCHFAIQPADIIDALKRHENPIKDWEELKACLPKVCQYESWRQYPMVIGEDENGKLITSDGRKELNGIFDSLPASVRAYVGSAENLAVYARVGSFDLDKYHRPVFMKEAAKAMPSPETIALLSAGNNKATKQIGGGDNGE